jgi:branched-chain amino acid transport system substrate-binding protein
VPLIASLAVLGAAGAQAPPAACKSPRIGFMGPITGDAAFIGKEQLGFAKYAIRKLGGGEVRLIEGDTQLSPARAATVAKTFHANRDVLAVVGPAGSQEVLAVAPIFTGAERLPFISGSATQASLTNGSIPSFFRVVPNDAAQPPTIARFIRRVLKAKAVLVVDDRTAYSRALANGVQARLRARGIRVTRRSVDQKLTDFSALVAKVGAAVDVVFLPWQIAANAQIFGRQLRQSGGKAIIVGSDAVDSGDFELAGSYVSSFAPDVRGIRGNDAFIAGYGSAFVSNFGPPVYVATQAAIAAIGKACADGRADRAEVEEKLQATFIRRIVLGGGLRFTARGDRRGASFSIFKVGAGGRRTLVGWT